MKMSNLNFSTFIKPVLAVSLMAVSLAAFAVPVNVNKAEASLIVHL
ncbi:MAG: hypothetical protein ACRBEE_12480 [Arenicella sp.]